MKLLPITSRSAIYKCALLLAVWAFATDVTAQKKFKNGISLSVGSEYLLNEEVPFTNFYSVFTEKPMYGASLGYYRRLGKLFSVEASGGYFYSSINTTEFSRDINGNFIELEVMHQFQRMHAQVGLYLWAVEQKKYAFTPGIALAYGRTLAYNFFVEDFDFEEKFKTNHKYANASLQLRNRFLLKRFRSSLKGNYAEMLLLVSPYLAVNFYKDLDWQGSITPEPAQKTLFGGGLFVGLDFSF